MTSKLEVPPTDREPRCANCGTTGADFAHHGRAFCCECMSALCSWLLDGGTVDSPGLFAWVYADTAITT